jgi:putative RNA 2'-phosphotransferase
MTSVNKNRKSRDENEMAKYNEKELADTSKFLSFVLRHKPEAIGIVLDREGWADIDKLILCAQKAGKRLTRALLDTVVATSDKKRFSYSSDGRCIRAVQGHSTSQVAISFAEHRHSFSTTVRQAVSLTR